MKLRSLRNVLSIILILASSPSFAVEEVTPPADVVTKQELSEILIECRNESPDDISAIKKCFKERSKQRVAEKQAQ